MTYRADIDGLRSIAVLLVIFFHFGIGFSGGYIGVDVFFVLSGYLIGSIIFSQVERQKFSFGNFYFRRIRRLFPVYIVVMLVTAIGAYQLMLPNDLRDFGQSLLSSTVYVSNILFFMEAGYFDTASHFKPLLHTWSLSVEEQFYVVFPVLAWLLRGLGKRWLLAIFGGLMLASLLAAAWMVQVNHSAAFFLYPFRAWEMFIGSILALHIIPECRKALINVLLAVGGILLIMVPAVMYDGDTLFPGLSAFLPCFGTALLIYTGMHNQTAIHKWLSHSLPVFIGKISYSLYLWHWPVYVLYIYSLPSDPDAVDIAIMLALTFVLSVLSWRFVEAPFREGKVLFSRTHRSVFASTFVISGAFILFGLLLHKTHGMPQRLSAEDLDFVNTISSLQGDKSHCHPQGTDERYPDLSFCEIGEPRDQPYVLIWGDSHAAVFKDAISVRLREQGLNGLLVWKGGCPAIRGVRKDESVASAAQDQQCDRIHRGVEKLLAEDRERIQAVVLIGRWSYYLNDGGVGIDAENRVQVFDEGSQQALSATQILERLDQTIASLQQQLNVPVFMIEQPPEFKNYEGRKVAILMMHADANDRQQLDRFLTLPIAALNQRQHLMADFLDRLEGERRITVLRTQKYLCDSTQCDALFDGRPVYYDNNHLSTLGAQRIGGYLDALKLGQP